MSHNCYGLVQYYRDSFAGSPFAATGYNAAIYREDVKIRMLRSYNWPFNAQVRRWDYVLARHDWGQSRSNYVELVHVEDQHGTSSRWALYRVIRPTRPP